MTLKNTDISDHLILEGNLPRQEPPETDYSAHSYVDLLDKYAAAAMKGFLQTQRPLIELEQLLRSGHQFFILTGGTARGKTRAALLYLLHETWKHQTYGLAIVRSRSDGEELRKKCAKYLKLLDDPRRVVTYYGGRDQDEKNQKLRKEIKQKLKGKPRIALLITTLFKYDQSLTAHSELGASAHTKYLEKLASPGDWGETFASAGVSWFKKLASPAFVFLDEIDSYPLHMIYCLAMIVRMIRWQDTETRVILSSATLSNPEDLAEMFFGQNAAFLHLSGTGRRGPTQVKVYYEKNPQELLWERCGAIHTYIGAELKEIKPGKRHIPRKIILFINNKRDIDTHRIIGTFTDNFVTVHGDMPTELIAQNLKEFREKALKICLVATNIAQSALNVSNVFWVVGYGVPNDVRQYRQQRGRGSRNPDQPGYLDIILRATHTHEVELANPQKLDACRTFILGDTPTPLKIPRFTSVGLKYGIIIGLVFGFWDVRARLKKELASNGNFEVIQALGQAYLDLLLAGKVTVGSEERIRPTPYTRHWVYNFPDQFSTEPYTVALRQKDGTEKKLGTISLLHLLRSGLPSQIFPYINENLKIISIIPWERKVIVERAFQPLEYYHNQVETTLEITKTVAYHPEAEIGLVEVLERHQVTFLGVDKRSRAELEPYYPFQALAADQDFKAIFLPKRITLPVVNQMNQLYDHLNLDHGSFRQVRCRHEKYGAGTIFTDTTHLGLAEMMYEQWLVLEEEF